MGGRARLRIAFSNKKTRDSLFTHFRTALSLKKEERKEGRKEGREEGKKVKYRKNKTEDKLQLRRAIRAYVNRLYYVNKDRDIFLFEEFMRKEFRILNE